MLSFEIDMAVKPDVTGFFDPATNTISYIVRDPTPKSCAVVDSVMDIDYAAGRISDERADEIIAEIQGKDLTLEWLIETHVHADHLSAAPYIQSKLGGKIGIGRNITIVQEMFGKVFSEGTEFQRDGSQFDRLFDDGDVYEIGSMRAVAIHTPGHRPACMTHIVGDAAWSNAGNIRKASVMRREFERLERVDMKTFMEQSSHARSNAWERLEKIDEIVLCLKPLQLPPPTSRRHLVNSARDAFTDAGQGDQSLEAVASQHIFRTLH